VCKSVYQAFIYGTWVFPFDFSPLELDAYILILRFQ
jgi:hypothetical protein